MKLSRNWAVTCVIYFFIPSRIWLLTSRSILLLYNATVIVNTELKTIIPQTAPGNTIICVILIFFLVIINTLGLTPYVFTSSRHLVFCISLALPLWMGHITIASQKTPLLILSHLVPSGSPTILAPFMVLIELIRNLIRPLTLSVRLTANIIAGHLLLTLVSSVCPNYNLPIISLIFVPLILLISLEIAVALIQAYVFRVLNTLYLREVDSNHLNL